MTEIELLLALSVIEWELPDDFIELLLGFCLVEDFLVEDFELDTGHDGLLVVLDAVDYGVLVVLGFGFEHWAVLLEELCQLLFC